MGTVDQTAPAGRLRGEAPTLSHCVLVGESQEGMGTQQFHILSLGLWAAGLGWPGCLIYFLGTVGPQVRVPVTRQQVNAGQLSLGDLLNLPVWDVWQQVCKRFSAFPLARRARTSWSAGPQCQSIKAWLASSS